MSRLRRWFTARLIRWLTAEHPAGAPALDVDFPGLLAQIQPADVLLIDGQSRVSDIIKSVSQSSWSHVALYLGRPSDFSGGLGAALAAHGAANEPLILEVLLGQGAVVNPLVVYRDNRMRICRARALAAADREAVVQYVLQREGYGYDLRQLVDLARFMLPWGLLPRRWRSSLFRAPDGRRTRTVCSSLIAEAYQAVNFPVLPVVQRDASGKVHWRKRDARLYTPKDFDLSPFFDIVKYPPRGYEVAPAYRAIDWEAEVCNGPDDCLG